MRLVLDTAMERCHSSFAWSLIEVYFTKFTIATFTVHSLVGEDTVNLVNQI